MAHPVTCSYCNIKFDRDKEPFIKTSKARYAHLKCVPEDEKDYLNLINYIYELFDKNNQSYSQLKIERQIYTFKQEYNFTFSGMLGTLMWWYEVEKNPLDKSNGGIGIIPYIYNQAKDYYLRQDKIQNANSKEEIEKYNPKIVTIEITPPEMHKRPPKLFRMEEINE